MTPGSGCTTAGHNCLHVVRGPWHSRTGTPSSRPAAPVRTTARTVHEVNHAVRSAGAKRPTTTTWVVPGAGGPQVP